MKVPGLAISHVRPAISGGGPGSPTTVSSLTDHGWWSRLLRDGPLTDTFQVDMFQYLTSSNVLTTHTHMVTPAHLPCQTDPRHHHVIGLLCGGSAAGQQDATGENRLSNTGQRNNLARQTERSVYLQKLPESGRRWGGQKLVLT
ncbi:hypothetical protein ElyMa_005076900 [Elysia marginata]|uniref:Uncharacterized protein n=1 Tax=Elysia marginata TaxID=1093978 RepID=A0AAV4JGN3_9GAST|nr:hypothetical protein ElyMa_005076900 [Elysia marginata]